MKTTAAFRALAQNRLALSKEAKPFVVRRLNKDGSVSRAQATIWDHAATQVEADQMVATRMALNPGSRYVVTTKEVA